MDIFWNHTEKMHAQHSTFYAKMAYPVKARKMDIIKMKKMVDFSVLLQIVMVSPGTHLVKNHESLFITNESQFTKNDESGIKSAWAFM